MNPWVAREQEPLPLLGADHDLALPNAKLWRGLCGLAFLFAIFALAACGGGAGKTGNLNIGGPGGNAALVSVHQGRLVNVFGLRTVGAISLQELVQIDVLVGSNIADQRDGNSNLKDNEILYDFTNTDPETLQLRLLITREIGSAEFRAAFDALDDGARLISPDQSGRDTSVVPYPVVARNAGLRLTFARDLGITDDFFVDRNAFGQVIGIKNSEAIQLLKIVGDPNDAQDTGDFQVIPSRFVVRGNQILVDSVLLGSEGLRFNAKNTAEGMPASSDQVGANIRLAVALAGPLSIPGVQADSFAASGRNNSGVASIIRDYRSGNDDDNSSELSRVFVLDNLPPRVVGNLPMLLEGIGPGVTGTKVISLFKNGLSHEIDQGDVLRLFDDSSQLAFSLDILQEPQADLGLPSVQRVDVVVAAQVDDQGVDLLQAFFAQNSAPQAILVAEFVAERSNPLSGLYYGDDFANFLDFTPAPLGGTDVSPFAGAIVHFSKPVNLAKLRPLDNAFIATRNLLDPVEIAGFLEERGMPATEIDNPEFIAKFRTPHLVQSRVFDETGSQTSIRIQPTQGLYLDDAIRDAATQGTPYQYYFHLFAGPGGIEDLAGNFLDFQSETSVITSQIQAFTLDTSNRLGTTEPRFANNLVAYVVRRFAAEDEDERPSLYRDQPGSDYPKEVTVAGETPRAAELSVPDLFGPVIILASGQLQARQTARVTRVVDNRNQVPPPPQNIPPAPPDPLQWCPTTTTGPHRVTTSAGLVFSAPIQNPYNPFGSRLQTLWREIDFSLSRTDPNDFNLDVEQMYWAPFQASPITFDEFDNVSLFLGHSEYRPETCVLAAAATPAMPNSGLRGNFDSNFARNLDAGGVIDDRPKPHPAFKEAVLTISSQDTILEPTLVNRFLPLPDFEDATLQGFSDPLFVWRDERVLVQGGRNGLARFLFSQDPNPYVVSPFCAGMGGNVIDGPVINGQSSLSVKLGGWYSQSNTLLAAPAVGDVRTEGLVGSIGLPLLAEFQVLPDSPDSPELPLDDPFQASGQNGSQVSISVGSSPRPDFRVYSAGGVGISGPTIVGPGSFKWANAAGGIIPNGGRTPPGDNTLYWIMADFLKRSSVVTFGFVDIMNPHRMPEVMSAGADPRLGPYQVGQGMLPDFTFDFEPPLADLPPGTAVMPEFRAAGEIDPNPWPAQAGASRRPNAANFPLSPCIAGDAHIKHWDDRNARNTWTYLYNLNLTTYQEDPNRLMVANFTDQFGGPNESFTPADVRYFNWRFIMRNNVQANPPVSPIIESFSVSYRFTQR